VKCDDSCYFSDVVGFAQAAVGEALRDVAPTSSSSSSRSSSSSTVASVTFCVGNAFDVIKGRSFDRIICRCCDNPSKQNHKPLLIFHTLNHACSCAISDDDADRMLQVNSRTIAWVVLLLLLLLLLLTSVQHLAPAGVLVYFPLPAAAAASSFTKCSSICSTHLQHNGAAHHHHHHHYHH
jgi:hypothetical protein